MPKTGFNPCRRRTTRPGFTLVELLVVLAVIGLLTALFSVSVGRARARAQRIQCASNLRQLFLGCVLYANENRTRLPNGITQTADEMYYTPAGESSKWLQDQLVDYLEGTTGNISDIWKCPAVRKDFLKADPQANDYRYNVAQAGGKALESPLNPPEAILLFDAAWVDWPEGDLPHEGINAVYMDGHVELVPSDTFYANMSGDLNSKLMTDGWQ